MRESSFSRQVRKVLRKAGWPVCRVENPCEPGFPDICYATPQGRIGLLELKARPSAPVHQDSKAGLGVRTVQSAFAAQWSYTDAPVVVLAKVGRQYVLTASFDPDIRWVDLIETALWHGTTLTDIVEPLSNFTNN